MIKTTFYKNRISKLIKTISLCSCLYVSTSNATDISHTETSNVSPSLTTVNTLAAKQLLLTLLKEVAFFSAKFNQQIFDEAGNLLQEGSGKLAVKKPNLVNWHTVSPDELSIISDGVNIWFYDPFIEQVTAYTFVKAITNTPVLLLTSNDESLWDHYSVSQSTDMKADDSSSALTFSINSNDANSQIKRLVLSFTAINKVNTLSKFTFEDATGQVSVISLEDVDYDTVPSDALFTFSLPEGVNIDDQR